MTKLIAMAIPIKKEKTEQWKKFSNDLKSKYKKEYLESRKTLGVRERTFLQSSPDGNLVIVTIEGENPAEAFKKMMGQTDEFTKWFVSQISEIHGIDFTKPGAMPPLPELVIDSEPVAEEVHH